MTGHRAYLARRIERCHQVLSPKADAYSPEQRHGARCRLNRAVKALKAAGPVPRMKVMLGTDRIAAKAAARLSRAS